MDQCKVVSDWWCVVIGWLRSHRSFTSGVTAEAFRTEVIRTTDRSAAIRTITTPRPMPEAETETAPPDTADTATDRPSLPSHPASKWSWKTRRVHLSPRRDRFRADCGCLSATAARRRSGSIALPPSRAPRATLPCAEPPEAHPAKLRFVSIPLPSNSLYKKKLTV